MTVEPGAQEEYWPLLTMASHQYDEEGNWPHLDDLIYELASRNIDIGLSVPSKIPRFLGFINNEGELELSALGLILSGSAPRSTEAIVHLVQLCVRLALEFRRSAKISSAVVADNFVDDDFVSGRALELVSKVPGLVGGGSGAKSDEDWFRDITVSALEYKEIETADDLVRNLLHRLQTMGTQGILKIDTTSDLRSIFTDSIERPDLVEDVRCDPRNVFVIYGRDTEATEAMWTFLEALGLHPLSWDEMVRSTGIATPYTGEVVARAFEQVQAVVVLLTPDDEARLHESLRKVDDPVHETSLTGQPRPNVFFEAGMAFGRHPDRTIIVEVGLLRPASDLLGRNTVRMGSTEGPLEALANRLEGAGCPVNRAHPAWLKTERFTNLAAQVRKPNELSDDVFQLPRGTKLPKVTRSAEARITARLIAVSKNDYLLEVVNRGNTDVCGVQWELPEGAKNWSVITAVLPEYPIPELLKGDHIRVPVAVMMSGPVMTDLRITAVTADGDPYETSARLSIYG